MFTISSAVDRVQLEFGATVIHDHPFTEKACTVLIEDAVKLIGEERATVADGQRVPQWTRKENKCKYLRPVPVSTPPQPQTTPAKSRPRTAGRILEEVNVGDEASGETPSPGGEHRNRKKKHFHNSSSSSLNSDVDLHNQYNSKSCQIV